MRNGPVPANQGGAGSGVLVVQSAISSTALNTLGCALTMGSSPRLTVPSKTVRSSGPWNVVTVAEQPRHRHRLRELFEVLGRRVVGHAVDHDEGVWQSVCELLTQMVPKAQSRRTGSVGPATAIEFHGDYSDRLNRLGTS